MYLTAGNNEGPTEICPEGVYPLHVWRLVDLGSQPQTYNGETREVRKLSLTGDVLDPDTRRSDGTPFLLSRRFTASLHEKSAFRPAVQALLGRPIVDGERVNLRELVGKYALAVITHGANTQGQTFANLSSLVPLPKNKSKPGPVHEPLVYLIDEDDEATLAKLPEQMQKLVRASPEYALRQQAATQRAAAPRQGPAQPRPAPATRAMDDLTDDVPF